jgi:hypothetical protein
VEVPDGSWLVWNEEYATAPLKGRWTYQQLPHHRVTPGVTRGSVLDGYFSQPYVPVNSAGDDLSSTTILWPIPSIHATILPSGHMAFTHLTDAKYVLVTEQSLTVCRTPFCSPDPTKYDKSFFSSVVLVFDGWVEPRPTHAPILTNPWSGFPVLVYYTAPFAYMNVDIKICKDMLCVDSVVQTFTGFAETGFDAVQDIAAAFTRPNDGTNQYWLLVMGGGGLRSLKFTSATTVTLGTHQQMFGSLEENIVNDQYDGRNMARHISVKPDGLPQLIAVAWHNDAEFQFVLMRDCNDAECNNGTTRILVDFFQFYDGQNLPRGGGMGVTRLRNGNLILAYWCNDFLFVIPVVNQVCLLICHDIPCTTNTVKVFWTDPNGYQGGILAVDIVVPAHGIPLVFVLANGDGASSDNAHLWVVRCPAWDCDVDDPASGGITNTLPLFQRQSWKMLGLDQDFDPSWFPKVLRVLALPDGRVGGVFVCATGIVDSEDDLKICTFECSDGWCAGPIRPEDNNRLRMGPV